MILWADVWKEAGRGKSRFTIRDLVVGMSAARRY